MAAGIGKLAGAGAAGEQLLIWEVLGAIISAALQPELTLLTREVNKLLPATPLSPAELADMVVRNIVDPGSATSYARESGISDADFLRMVHSAGEAPSPQELVTALRRSVIPHDGTGPDSISFQQGIAESRLYNKWRPVIEALANVPLPVSEAVDGVVESQLTLEQGQHYAYLSGVSAEDFGHMVNIRGNPPSPGELATLLKRGLIPLTGTGPDVVSFQQGIFEGATKDKWWELFAKLADYIPPPRTVTTMVRDGTVSDEQALVWYQDAGLTPETAKLYLADAHHQRTVTHKAVIATELRTVARREFASGHIAEAQFRELLTEAGVTPESIDLEVKAATLAKSSSHRTFSLAQIKRQRQDGVIDDAQARVRLVAQGWTEDDAQTLINEWNAEATAGHSGFTESRILGYLQAGVLTPPQAYDLLVARGIKATDAKFLVDHPSSVPATRIHGSTAADIVAAYKDGLITQGDAEVKLIDSGETADAAALRLRIANYTLNRGPKPKQAHKSLTAAEILEAFKLGLAQDTWALRELAAAGYTDTDAALLVAIEETKATKAVPTAWTVLT
jgi:hypothetical protein